MRTSSLLLAASLTLAVLSGPVVQAQTTASVRPLTEAAAAREMDGVAQEIELFCPELIKRDAATGLKVVRRSLLTPALLRTERDLELRVARTKAQPAADSTQDEENRVRIEVLRTVLAHLQSARLLLAVMDQPATASLEPKPRPKH